MNWKKLIASNPIAFGIDNGFKDLTELHNEWIKSFLFSKEDYTLQAHRGSFKTTCLAIAISLMVVYDSAKNIIFLRKTDTDVKEVVNLVANLLKSEIYNCLSEDIYGTPITLTRESAFEVDTNLNCHPSGASQLLGLGSKASMTGKHGDIIITDDIINLVDRISPAERERTKLTYQELQNIKNRNGRLINCGTPWHKEDAFTLMPNLHKFDCYSTGLVSDGQLQMLRNSMSPSLFAANYELKHIADENQMFMSPVIADGDITNGICHIDASYGGEDGTAFTIAKQRNGKIYVYGALRQKHVDNCITEFEAKRKIYQVGTCYMERNADKGYLAQKIQKPVQTYHENMNKFIKISTYLKSEWENIVFIKGTDPDYINQILDYTENAKHDDAPDSLASIIRIIKKDKPIDTAEQIKALKAYGL